MAEVSIGEAADRVLNRVAAISGFRALLDTCPYPVQRRNLIRAAHANGAINDQELTALLAEAA
jgi:hypothetical protein